MKFWIFLGASPTWAFKVIKEIWSHTNKTLFFSLIGIPILISVCYWVFCFLTGKLHVTNEESIEDEED